MDKAQQTLVTASRLAVDIQELEVTMQEMKSRRDSVRATEKALEKQLVGLQTSQKRLEAETVKLRKHSKTMTLDLSMLQLDLDITPKAPTRVNRDSISAVPNFMSMESSSISSLNFIMEDPIPDPTTRPASSFFHQPEPFQDPRTPVLIQRNMNRKSFVAPSHLISLKLPRSTSLDMDITPRRPITFTTRPSLAHFESIQIPEELSPSESETSVSDVSAMCSGSGSDDNIDCPEIRVEPASPCPTPPRNPLGTLPVSSSFWKLNLSRTRSFTDAAAKLKGGVQSWRKSNHRRTLVTLGGGDENCPLLRA